MTQHSKDHTGSGLQPSCEISRKSLGSATFNKAKREINQPLPCSPGVGQYEIKYHLIK